MRRWRGRVVKHLGDGLLCTFPDASEGIRAALELLATPPASLRLRAGLHVGEAVVSRDDVVGHVVNIAATVTETAKGNQVVVTRETAEAGPVPGAEFQRLALGGPIKLAGDSRLLKSRNVEAQSRVQ